MYQTELILGKEDKKIQVLRKNEIVISFDFFSTSVTGKILKIVETIQNHIMRYITDNYRLIEPFGYTMAEHSHSFKA